MSASGTVDPVHMPPESGASRSRRSRAVRAAAAAALMALGALAPTGWWLATGADASRSTGEGATAPGGVADTLPVDAERSLDTAEPLPGEAALAALEALSARVAALERAQRETAPLATRVARLDELSPRLDTHAIRLAALEKRTARADDAKALAALRKQVAELGEQLATVEARVRRNAVVRSLRAASPKTSKPTAPPFEVVGLDWWDGRASAVVRAEGETTFLALGEEHAGWRLDAVDPDNRALVFVGPDGQRANRVVAR